MIEIILAGKMTEVGGYRGLVLNWDSFLLTRSSTGIPVRLRGTALCCRNELLGGTRKIRECGSRTLICDYSNASETGSNRSKPWSRYPGDTEWLIPSVKTTFIG